ncbi:MAG: hypothetical protein ACHQ53_17650 [Polyangiales bacterium]
MKAPQRLRDDPAAAPAVREDLERARAAVSGYDVAAGLIALQSSIAASGTAAASGASAGHAAQVATAKGGSALGAAGVKLTLSALGAAAAVAAGVTLWPAQRPVPAPRPAVTAPTIARATKTATPEAPAAPTAPAQDEPTAEAEAPAPSTPTHRNEALAPVVTGLHRARHTTQNATAPQPNDALHREIAQLGEIKTSLESDPARAYHLAELGNHEFRHGALVQEREALAVLALWNLGRHGEAVSRERAFLERYPQSPLRERLQAVLHSDAP